MLWPDQIFLFSFFLKLYQHNYDSIIVSIFTSNILNTLLKLPAYTFVSIVNYWLFEMETVLFPGLILAQLMSFEWKERSQAGRKEMIVSWLKNFPSLMSGGLLYMGNKTNQNAELFIYWLLLFASETSVAIISVGGFHNFICPYTFLSLLLLLCSNNTSSNHLLGL